MIQFGNLKLTYWHNILLAFLVGILISVGVLVRTHSPSIASPHGCQYDDNSISPITYAFFSVGSLYQNAMNDGAGLWNNTSAPGNLTLDNSDTSPEIDVRDGVFLGNWWATASWGYVQGVSSYANQCGGDGTYPANKVTIRFDTGSNTGMGGLSAAEKALVAAHEIGHAYGLGHVSGCHVMVQGQYKFNCGSVPSSSDIAFVDQIYP